MVKEQALEGQRRRERALWVAREIIPHEVGIRRWLRRSRIAPEEADDLLQEAYCRISLLDSVEHIDTPSAYFFSIVRSLLVRQLKRQRIVPFEVIADAESAGELAFTIEAELATRHAYKKVVAMIAALPERCRKAVQLRKIEGWSQKQIASHLGTTEKAVEKQLWLGVRMVQHAWAAAEEEGEDHLNRPERREERQ